MPIGQLGMMLAGAGLGQILAPINDRRQLRQQEKLQQLQMQGNKEMTDYNTRKQMEMWENTSYPAQMAMLKKAGLNPALMYGMGGGGGTTANISQGNVGTAQAPQGGGEIMGLMGMGLQSQMIQAQIELTKAQTQKTEAETGGIPSTIQKTQAETINIQQATEKLRAETTNAQTQNAIMSVQKNILDLEEAFQSGTLQNRITQVDQLTKKIGEEIKIIQNDREISDATKKDKIQQIKAEAIGAAVKNNLMRVQISEGKQNIQESKTRIQSMQHQIHNWASEIAQKWEGLHYTGQQQEIEKLKLKLQQETGYDWRGVRYEFSDNTINMIDNIIKKTNQ